MDVGKAQLDWRYMDGTGKRQKEGQFQKNTVNYGMIAFIFDLVDCSKVQTNAFPMKYPPLLGWSPMEPAAGRRQGNDGIQQLLDVFLVIHSVKNLNHFSDVHFSSTKFLPFLPPDGRQILHPKWNSLVAQTKLNKNL